MPTILFEYPWLLSIVLLPLIVRRVLPEYRQSKPALAIPFLSRLIQLTGREAASGSVVTAPSFLQSIAMWLAWICIVLALARPQRLEQPLTKTIPTRDLLLAVDLSGSMETQDFTDTSGKQVDRLTAVKQVLDDFLSRRKGDRVGLIFFGSAAFVQAPFTEDLDACRTLLDEAQVRMAGPKTAFGDAIGLALTVFEHDADVRDRVLIALTDGNDTGSQVPPDRAAQIAHDRNIVIHTVAVGDPTAAGEEKLDEETLKTVASTTGGRYSRANDRAALAQIYAQLDTLETRELETVSHRPRSELFSWPLAAALLVTLAYHLACAARTIWRHASETHRSTVEATAMAVAIPFLQQFGEFHFLRPWWWLALLPTLAVYWIIRANQDAGRTWSGVIDEHLLPYLLSDQQQQRWPQPRHLLLAVWLLMIAALAGPTWQREQSPFADDEAALVVVMKITPTMLAEDIQPSRLSRATLKLHDLLDTRPGTRTALVAYAGSEHLVMPLTRDSELIERFASELSPEVMPKEGDVVSEALQLANEQLRKANLRGSILLMADSVPPDQLSTLATYRSKGGVPIQILACAADANVPVPPDSPPAPALDMAAMTKAANAVGGTLTVLSADDTDVQWLSRHTVTSLATAESAERGDRWQDAGYWLVFGIVGLASFWFRRGWAVVWQ